MTNAPDVRKRRRRWVRVVVALLVVSLAGLAGYYLIADQIARRSIAKAVAQLDANDRGWRLENIKTARAVVPEHENGARFVAAVRAQTEGKDVSELRLRLQWLKTLPPFARLADKDRDDLERALGQFAAALGVSATLADRPRGRHELRWERNLFRAPTDDQYASLATCELWCLQAALLAERGEVSQALRAARAALNAGRSIGDEPLVETQLGRAWCARQAAGTIERVLGQGTPPAATLAELQELTEDEDRHQGYLLAMRGERAEAHAVHELLFRGEATFAELIGEPKEGWLSPPNWWEVHKVRRGYARYLSYRTRLVEIARGAMWEQHAAEQALIRELRELPTSSGAKIQSLITHADTGDSFRRKHASMRCLAAMLAVERYRQAEGKWPAALADLVPTYLAAGPVDPFDGQPLRFKTREGEARVYSVGPDGTDHGGNLVSWDREGRSSIGNYGFRLYNPEHRRQPPLPKEGGDDDDP